jgi:hypothetical protein
MMFYISMDQSIASNRKSNAYHAPLKERIMDDIDTK